MNFERYGLKMYAPMYGLKVIAVDRSSLFFENGDSARFELDGDCCSTSDFTDDAMLAFKELIGRTIVSIEDRDGSSSQAVEEKYPEGDQLSWHFLVITTDKGHVTIDWRNDSNGYYDGTCFPVDCPPLHPVTHDAIVEGQSLAQVLALEERRKQGEAQ